MFACPHFKISKMLLQLFIIAIIGVVHRVLYPNTQAGKIKDFKWMQGGESNVYFKCRIIRKR